MSKPKIQALWMCPLFVLFLLFTSCQRYHTSSVVIENVGTTESGPASVDPVNTEMKLSLERGVVLNRVKDIYSLIKAEYAFHGGSYESEWFDRAFCSKSWNKLLMAVRCKEERTGTLFFDIDRWSMLRSDGERVSFEEFEVENLWAYGKQMRASVSFVVYGVDTYTPARIDLVYEDNHWVIDNFHNLRYMLDVRNCMWNYLANDII